MVDNTEALTIAVRAIHFAFSIGLFGEFVFFLVAGLAYLEPGEKGLVQAAMRRRLLTATTTWLGSVPVSANIWARASRPITACKSRTSCG